MIAPPPLSRFVRPDADEVFCSLESPPGLELGPSLDDLLGRYDELLAAEGLGPASEIFLRFHTSDLVNQAGPLAARLEGRASGGLVSTVGQPPASGARIALQAYHLRASGGLSIRRSRPSPEALAVAHGPYTSLWLRGRPGVSGAVGPQTRQLFDHLGARLAPLGGGLRDEVLRTWIYVRDIDNNYQAMVDARRELFAAAGLTRHTHTIASTGVEGTGERPAELVIMDSLSVMGLEPGQVTFLSAPAHLCPTYEYGVTFERGTRVTYGDRSHFYISGTASIDGRGEILCEGDVAGQTRRTLENIVALLEGQGAGAADLMQLTVYLRDPADGPRVEALLREALPPSIPWILVRGAVCRPGWLVEIEGVAVSDRADPAFAPFAGAPSLEVRTFSCCGSPRNAHPSLLSEF